MKYSSSKILNKIVSIGIVLTLVALIAMPFILTVILERDFGIIEGAKPIKLSIGIYICAIPYLISLVSLKKLCKQTSLQDPFSRTIPKYLKQISICAFSEILIFNVVQLVLHYFFDVYLYGMIISALIVSFVSLSIGFFGVVLGKLFEMAIEIKDENDKTI